MQVYIAPYLIVNMWLVMITLLQHTHPSLPHYNDQEWEWLRGALSTVDRSYGLLDIVFHHIADTHVCHHLFSTMPHYHAQVRSLLHTARDGVMWSSDARSDGQRPLKTSREQHWRAEAEGAPVDDAACADCHSACPCEGHL